MIDYNKFKQDLQHREAQCITKVVLEGKEESLEGSWPDSTGSDGNPGEVSGYGE